MLWERSRPQDLENWDLIVLAFLSAMFPQNSSNFKIVYMESKIFLGPVLYISNMVTLNSNMTTTAIRRSFLYMKSFN